MPFFDSNPVTPPRIVVRLKRALAQNRAARREPGVAEAAPLGWQPEDIPLTTVDATIRPIGARRYRRLGWAAGEPHLTRCDLGVEPSLERSARRRSLLYFAQHTDIHITDAQSPSRLVGAQALGWIHPGTDASHRPNETMTTHVLDQLVRATNRVADSPFSGAPMAFCLQTGDHTDNRTAAELEWWLAVLGGHIVTPNTGTPGRYEGVQRSGWRTVWNPDLYRADRPQRHGYPFLPGVLDAAVAPFQTEGMAMPWLSVLGNHDRIFSGTFGPTRGVRIDLLEPRLRDAALLPVRASRLIWEIARASMPMRASRATPRAARRGALSVASDSEARTPVDSLTYLDRVRSSPGGDLPVVDDVAEGDTWWSIACGERVQLVGLDTTNHTNGEGGRVGPRQRAWLERELRRHHSRDGGTDRLVVVVSHHNSWVIEGGDDVFDPGSSTDGHELVDLFARFPNVVLWLSGHSHEHRVAAHRSGERDGSGFWEVSNASVVAFGQQGRLFELFDNADGTVSILSTVLDHAAPPAIDYPKRVGDWGPQQLASLSRELSANDDRWLDPLAALGRIEDRNVELVVRAPFPLS